MSESGSPSQFPTNAPPASEVSRPEAPASVEPPQRPEAPVAGGADTPVAAALRELETLGDRPLAEHPDVYQGIHAELQAALATIDNA